MLREVRPRVELGGGSGTVSGGGTTASFCDHHGEDINMFSEKKEAHKKMAMMCCLQQGELAGRLQVI